MSERYEVLTPIDTGAFSVVYRAHDKKRDIDVAMKVPLLSFCLDSHRLGTYGQFFRESQVTAKNDHPHVIQLYDFYWGPHPFSGDNFIEEKIVPTMILQLFDPEQSPTLAAVLLSRRLSPEEAANFLEQVADALDCQAEKGVLILDLKPQHIILDPTFEAVIIDLGLVPGVVTPGPGYMAGTPSYMAPEQIGIKSSGIDLRTLEFNLGTILYESITGKLPFGKEDDDAYERMMSIVIKPFNKEHLNVLPESVRSKVIKVLNKALAKDKKNRYSTCSEFAEAFRKAIT